MATPNPQPSLPASGANLQLQNIIISTRQTLNHLNNSSTILQGTRTNSPIAKHQVYNPQQLWPQKKHDILIIDKYK